MKIIFCGDTLTQTSGLNYAALNLCEYLLKAGHEVNYAVLLGSESSSDNWKVHDIKYKNLFMLMKIYNCQPSHPQDFDKAVSEFHPDMVISLQDPWNLDAIFHCKFRSSFIWINYCLFEVSKYPEYVMSRSHYTKDMQKPIGKYYRDVDVNIPVTQLAAQALKPYNAKVWNDNIFLGIHLDQHEKRVSKSDVFGNTIKDNEFIFCSINRNSERKQIPILLEAFSMFLEAQKYPQLYKLYLHTNLAEQIGGTDLLSMINELKLQNNILSPRCFIDGKTMSREDLYKRISVCDCYVTTSGGEGFGYGVLEAMMHNLPVIYSDSGATREFCPNGIAVKPKYHAYANNMFTRWELVDAVDVAEAMLEIANDGRTQQHYPLDHMDWKTVGNKFVDAIEKIASTAKKKIRLERII